MLGWDSARYGNRWAQTPLNGGNSSSLSFNATTNQVNTAGFAYDAAGNMTADGTGNQYSYDAEGNLIQEVAPTGTMKCKRVAFPSGV